MKTFRITFRYSGRTGGVVFPIAKDEAAARAWFKQNFPTATIKVLKPCDFAPRRKAVQP